MLGISFLYMTGGALIVFIGNVLNLGLFSIALCLIGGYQFGTGLAYLLMALFKE